MTESHDAFDDFREKLIELYAQRKISWFFDLDGTLMTAPPGEHIAKEEDHNLEKLLNALYRQTDGRVAVVTGRPQAFIQSAMPRRKFPCVTEHGAILNRNSDSGKEILCASYDFDAIRNYIEDRIVNIENCYVEDHKEKTLTIEFTNAANPENLALELIDILDDIAGNEDIRQDHDPLKVVKGYVPGNYVVDLIPESADKAVAVKRLREKFSMLEDGIPVFCGDSAADAGAMQLCKDMGGFAIGVGPKAPDIADLRFENVDVMRAFLQDAIEAYNQTHEKPELRVSNSGKPKP